MRDTPEACEKNNTGCLLAPGTPRLAQKHVARCRANGDDRPHTKIPSNEVGGLFCCFLFVPKPHLLSPASTHAHVSFCSLSETNSTTESTATAGGTHNTQQNCYSSNPCVCSIARARSRRSHAPIHSHTPGSPEELIYLVRLSPREMAVITSYSRTNSSTTAVPRINSVSA